MTTVLQQRNPPLQSRIKENSLFNIPPFYTMEMMKLAAKLENEGKTIYHLEVGQPTVPTPQVVIHEAMRILREDPIGYCSALGVFELREAIAEHYVNSYGLKINPNAIVITPGTSLGLYIALLMNYKKGDKIAIASPSYPCYRNVIQSLGFELVEISTQCQNNFLITMADLEAQKDLAGILIASPNNPTGSMYQKADLKALSAYCQKKGIHIISDEIYHGITYAEKADTILNFNSKATVINGFSKYFAMTGWRLGWIVIDEKDVSRYESLLQNLILCSCPLTQMAAIQVFSAYKELDQHISKYKENRSVLYEALQSVGIAEVYKPPGAFYLYLELDKVGLGSMDLCKKLLYDTGVAVAPGMDFSSKPKKCSIRLSFCQSKEVIEIGAEKLNTFLKKL